jgi:MFS family permease
VEHGRERWMSTAKIVFRSSFTLAMLFFMLTTILCIISRSWTGDMERLFMARCVALVVGGFFALATALLGFVKELRDKRNIATTYALIAIVVIATFFACVLSVSTLMPVPHPL